MRYMLSHLVIDIGILEFVVDRFVIYQRHVVKPFATNQRNSSGKNFYEKKFRIQFVIKMYCIEYRQFSYNFPKYIIVIVAAVAGHPFAKESE